MNANDHSRVIRPWDITAAVSRHTFAASVIAALSPQLLGSWRILNEVANELHHQGWIIPMDHVTNVAGNNEHPLRGP